MFNFDLDDPKKLGLLMAAAGLMQGAGRGKNVGADLGYGLQQGLLGYQAGMGAKDKRAQEEQERQLRAMRMAQMQREERGQAAVEGVYSRNTMPGNLTPNDDEGNVMPTAPQGFNLQGLQSGLMSAGPAGMREYATIQAAMPKPKMAFAPNGQAVDMNNLQPGNYAPPEKTPDWQNPAYQKFMMDKARAGSSQVNVNTKQETEFGKALGKQQGEDYAGLMKSDMAASGTINKLSRLENLLASSGKTGKLTPPTMELKSVAESLGFKVDPSLPFQQAAQALSNEIALEMRNPSGGAGMPGALSDRDREFLQHMVPNLAKTAEGNKILIDTRKKIAQRDKEVAKLAREYRKQTGRFDEGFYQVLGEYSEKNPLFPQAEASALSAEEQSELEQLRRRFAR